MTISVILMLLGLLGFLEFVWWQSAAIWGGVSSPPPPPPPPLPDLIVIQWCVLSVCLHEDIIVILCTVSLSVVWDIRVIWDFYLIRGFGFLGFFAVIFLLLRFEMVV
jgi:hypothetical protein